jgi:hypothetical protein
MGRRGHNGFSPVPQFVLDDEELEAIAPSSSTQQRHQARVTALYHASPAAPSARCPLFPTPARWFLLFQAAFSLELDYSSGDDALLDWEQYTNMKRVKCCGIDVTPVVRVLPCTSPPQWW